MSICTSYSDSSERIVSPPLPMTIPMNSGLIWIVEIRGACSASASRGCRDRLVHPAEDRDAGVLRLREGLLHDLAADAGDLDVHLQGGDALVRAGDLEVHVAEVVLRALDVGEDLVVVAFLDEAHRDAGDRSRDRHAGVHQRERRAADRAHRRRAVRLERLGDDADRVREVLASSGCTASSARCASAPWPMSRRFGEPMRPVSPTE